MPRQVWLCTRPLFHDSMILPSEMTSDGRPYLRHWGVLVTELTIIDTKVILQSTTFMTSKDLRLGTMYELQTYNGEPNIFVDDEFSVERVRRHWGSFDAYHIGTTELPDETIKENGIYSHGGAVSS